MLDEHLARLKSVLAAIRTAHLTIKSEKGYYRFQALKFLGLAAGPKGVRAGLDKLAAVAEGSPPTDKAVQRFPGWCAYCRRFVEEFWNLWHCLLHATR